MFFKNNRTYRKTFTQYSKRENVKTLLQICEHNRQKRRCRECGGSAICEHKRRKDTCRECWGSQICEHQRQKHYCTDCGGAGSCPHKNNRSTCIFCDGNRVCIAHTVGPAQIRTKKRPHCIPKMPPFRWRHDIYSPDGKRVVRTFYEDERIQKAIDRGDSEEQVLALRNILRSMRGTLKYCC